MIKPISQEAVNSHKRDYLLFHSIVTAKEYSVNHGNRQKYKLPNGVYAVRRDKSCKKHKVCREGN